MGIFGNKQQEGADSQTPSSENKQQEGADSQTPSSENKQQKGAAGYTFLCTEDCTFGGRFYKEGDIITLPEKKEVPHFKLVDKTGE
jgi:hypothetical protein